MGVLLWDQNGTAFVDSVVILLKCELHCVQLRNDVGSNVRHKSLNLYFQINTFKWRQLYRKKAQVEDQNSFTQQWSRLTSDASGQQHPMAIEHTDATHEISVRKDIAPKIMIEANQSSYVNWKVPSAGVFSVTFIRRKWKYRLRFNRF